MAEDVKYFYLRLKDNFFETDEMIILESMEDGYKYSNILLKLYLRSIKNNGRLMFNDRIPFNSTMLAHVTRHSVGDIEKAVKIFQELGLIEILDNGAIYMLDIQEFIGKSSTEADRKRSYRAQIADEKNTLLGHLSGQMSDKCPDKNPPYIDIEIDTNTELDLDKKLHAEIAAKPAQKKHRSTKKQKSVISEDWTPSDRCKVLLENSGIPQVFYSGLIPEFVLYWDERQDARAGWDATFLNHAKRQWVQNQANSRNFSARKVTNENFSERDYGESEIRLPGFSDWEKLNS